MGIRAIVPDPENPKERIGGESIRIMDSQEKPSYVMLEDGTEIMAKISIIGAVRIDDRWDRDGNPSYNLTLNTMFSVSSPENLRKK